MIATDSIRKLNTSIIYLAAGVNPGPGVQGLFGGVNIGLEHILGDPEPRNLAEGVILSSLLNQCTVTISSDRLAFRDASGESPARRDFADRVTQAAEYIGLTSNTPYTGLGMNFGVEAEPEDEDLPSAAILRRLVKEDPLKDTKYDVFGSSIGLWYAAGGRLYDLRIEPRGYRHDERRYFAHLNVHIPLTSEVPPAQWLHQEMNEEYSDFLRVLTEVLDSSK